MQPSTVLRRMVHAAEQWGHEHFGASVTVEVLNGPQCCPDGSLQTAVALQPAGGQQKPVRCLVTLEPDGTLACFAPDAGI